MRLHLGTRELAACLQIQTCVSYRSLCAVPSAPTVQAGPSASSGVSAPSQVCACSEASSAHVSFRFAGLPVRGLAFLFFAGQVVCGQSLC